MKISGYNTSNPMTTFTGTEYFLGNQGGHTGTGTANQFKAFVLASVPTVSAGNRITNGSLLVNQRSYVSGTALAAGIYGHDRWKAGSGGCTYTFTATKPDTTITITAGTLLQIIEDANIEGGTYTLSWSGTATARVYQGAATGSYAASPITMTGLTAGANTTIEFSTGTVTRVQLEVGSTANVFARRPYGTELALCQRYYYRRKSAYPDPVAMLSAYSSTAAWGKLFEFPVEMRAVPTISFSALSDFQIYNAAASASGAPTSVSGLVASTRSAAVNGTIGGVAGAAYTAGQALFFAAANANGWIDASAEL